MNKLAKSVAEATSVLLCRFLVKNHAEQSKRRYRVVGKTGAFCLQKVRPRRAIRFTKIASWGFPQELACTRQARFV
jgi:hypothetical protein